MTNPKLVRRVRLSGAMSLLTTRRVAGRNACSINDKRKAKATKLSPALKRLRDVESSGDLTVEAERVLDDIQQVTSDDSVFFSLSDVAVNNTRLYTYWKDSYSEYLTHDGLLPNFTPQEHPVVFDRLPIYANRDWQYDSTLGFKPKNGADNVWLRTITFEDRNLPGMKVMLFKPASIGQPQQHWRRPGGLTMSR